MDQNQAQSPQKAPLLQFILNFLEILFASACIVFLIFFFVARLSFVSGSSMEHTFSNGDRVITSRLFYEPTAGDIVVVHKTGDTYNDMIIKRIIATEGQYVKIEPHGVYVSDDAVFDESELLDESAYAYVSGGFIRYANGQIYAVPEGHVFVLGDNRNNSKDSRDPDIGTIDERCIVGKVIFRFPLSNAD